MAKAARSVSWHLLQGRKPRATALGSSARRRRDLDRMASFVQSMYQVTSEATVSVEAPQEPRRAPCPLTVSELPNGDVHIEAGSRSLVLSADQFQSLSSPMASMPARPEKS